MQHPLEFGRQHGVYLGWIALGCQYGGNTIRNVQNAIADGAIATRGELRDFGL